MQIRRRPPSPSFSISHMRYQVSVPGSEPQNILEEIVWYKETEVQAQREKLPLSKLKQRIDSVAPPKNFLQALRQGKTQPALIAEVKKASPSKGIIRENFDPVEIARAYDRGGASCLSVLTDRKFFQGSFENLAKVRAAVDLPLLCKEFIIYPYQMYQARLHGADAVLLIAAILSDRDLNYFTKIIRALGMTPLVEVHSLEELDRVLSLDNIELIGINNRNLEDFTVDLRTTEELVNARRSQLQERDIVLVSESGLHTAQDLQFVASVGANAVLIGESLVKKDNPTEAIATLFV
ncbi:indole-3-glycerol phosphate synthase TrpC [Roseofilum casamattae]|uniref:Indole-3-glycerol phosphate synthase n=1 Tax=Roseofilum casamattae BLCC-M143 TaxID=3022442 RepID=A0ABT7C1S8_9CYAN|nr:indole-3-glycerol phosphate synthase TrpC [Roseofilum casamattae]MDJ1185398.1 indole-3-glycerol phosphate synthase TrpC [Roseofilum casamattae BLCC-M143]